MSYTKMQHETCPHNVIHKTQHEKKIKILKLCFLRESGDFMAKYKKNVVGHHFGRKYFGRKYTQIYPHNVYIHNV